MKKQTNECATTPQLIPLPLVDSNPYNSRVEFDDAEIERLADSISHLGLLSPILVRPKENRFEIVFGHRRVKAARLLKWNEIRAEVRSIADEEMIELSLIENLERENLSDYEKALCFFRMKKEFGKTLAQIGKLVGYSESHVCNYVRMLELFDEDALRSDKTILFDMRRISEHHARILLRIPNSRDRARMLKLVVLEKMSVRDLQRMLQRFRSWFADDDGLLETKTIPISRLEKNPVNSTDDLIEINQVVLSEFRLPREGDYESFVNHHSFDHGYSIFASNPPLKRFDDNLAIEQERGWFFGDALRLSAHIRDMRVQLHDRFAVVTLYVDHKGNVGDRKVEMSVRGTLVLSRASSGWKIVHEHWSNENYRQVEY